MFYNFSVANDTEFLYSNSLGGEKKLVRDAVGIWAGIEIFKG